MFSKESDEWRLGQTGEIRVMEHLKRRGYWVTPTSFIENGGAPLLEHVRQAFVLPDSLISRGGVTQWVEIKTKTRATRFMKTHRLEHGIGLRLWHSYLEVERITGIPGSLAIVELDRRMFGIADFHTIGETARIYTGNRMGQDGMVFFDCELFEWEPLDGLEDFPVIPPRNIRPGEFPLQTSLL